MKVKELLSDKSKWTQSANARDERGTAIYPRSEDAVCWCLNGAMMLCYEEYYEIFLKVRGEIKNHPINWNDAPFRTFEEVKALVEKLDI